MFAQRRSLSLAVVLCLTACAAGAPTTTTAPTAPENQIGANSGVPKQETAPPAALLATPTPAPQGALAGTALAPVAYEAAPGIDLTNLGALSQAVSNSLVLVPLPTPSPDPDATLTPTPSPTATAAYRLTATGGYRLQALVQAPLVGAPVQLFDTSNKAVTQQVLTDADGRYTLPSIPTTGGPYIVKVGLKTKEGTRNTVLETIYHPGDPATADADLVSSIITAGLLSEAKGNLAFVRQREFKRAAGTLVSVLDDANLPDLREPGMLAFLVTELLKTSPELVGSFNILTGKATPPPETPSPSPRVSGSPGASTSPSASSSAGATTTPGSGGPTPTAVPTLEPLTGPLGFLGLHPFLGQSGFKGYADGPAATAQLKAPNGVSFDSAGVLYLVDLTSKTVRRVDTDANSTVSTVAGLDGQTGDVPADPDVEATSGALFNEPTDLVVTKSPTDAAPWTEMVVVDRKNHTLVLLKRLASGEVTLKRLAGGPYADTPAFVEGTREAATFIWPSAIAYDGDQTLYVADSHPTDDTKPCIIAKVRLDTGVVTKYAGGERGQVDGNRATARFWSIGGLAVRKRGTGTELWVSDDKKNNLRCIREAAGGDILVQTMVAKLNAVASSENLKPLENARVKNPGRMAVDPSGSLFICEKGTNYVRWLRFDTNGNPEEAAFIKPPAGSGQTEPIQATNPAAIAVHPVVTVPTPAPSATPQLNRSGHLFIGQGDQGRVGEIY